MDGIIGTKGTEKEKESLPNSTARIPNKTVQNPNKTEELPQNQGGILSAQDTAAQTPTTRQNSGYLESAAPTQKEVKEPSLKFKDKYYTAPKAQSAGALSAQGAGIPQESTNDEAESELSFDERVTQRALNLQNKASGLAEIRAKHAEHYQMNLPAETYEMLDDFFAGVMDNYGLEAAEESRYKVMNAMQLSKILDIDLTDAIEHADEYNKAIWGNADPNYKTRCERLGDAWTQGVNTLRRADWGRKLMFYEQNGDTKEAEKCMEAIDALDKENEVLAINQPQAIPMTILTAGLQSLPYTGVAMASGFVSGMLGAGPLGSFLAGYELTCADEYIDMRKAGASVETAAAAANVSALGQAAVETFLDKVTGAIGAGAKVAGKKTVGGISKTLTDKISKQFYSWFKIGDLGARSLFRGAIKTGIEMTEEGAEEFIQSYISNGSKHLAKLLAQHRKEIGADDIDVPTLEEMSREAFESFKGGVAGAVLLRVGNVAFDAKASVHDFMEVQKLAKEIPSEEIFQEAVKDSPIFGGMDEKARKEATGQVYKNFEKDRLADIEESTDLSAGGEGSREDGEGYRVAKGAEFRTEEGELATETREDDEGKKYFVVGDTSRTHSQEADGNRYGYIEFSDDGKTVTINQFKMGSGREYLAKEFFSDFAAEHAGKKIVWKPRGETNLNLKKEIIESNPRGKTAGLNYFENAESVKEGKADLKIASQLKTAIPSMSAEQVGASVSIVKAVSRAQNMRTDEFLKRFRNEKIVTNEKTAEVVSGEADMREKLRAQGVSDENANITVLGAHSFDRFGKAVIYVAQDSRTDMNTFVHEFAHHTENYLTQEQRDTVLKELGFTAWTLAAHESFADALVDYLKTGKAKSEGLRAIFEKVAQVIGETIRGFQGKIQISDKLKETFDSLMSDDGTGLSKAMRAAEEAEKRLARRGQWEREQNARTAQSEDFDGETETDTNSDTEFDSESNAESDIDSALDSEIRENGTETEESRIDIRDEGGNLKSAEEIRREAKTTREAADALKERADAVIDDAFSSTREAAQAASDAAAENARAFEEEQMAIFQTETEADRQIEAVRKQYKGSENYMKAPNGEVTNLTERQWLTVRTPAFKKWFGDWESDPKNASKVVDENGEPLAVYHGSRTGGEFDVFKGSTFHAKDYETADIFKQEVDFVIQINGDRKIPLDKWQAENLAYNLTGGDYTINEISSWKDLTDVLNDAGEENRQWLQELVFDNFDIDINDIEHLAISENSIYQDFVNIRNPLTVDFNNEVWGRRRTVEQYFEAAHKDGHDGILVKNIIEGGLTAETRNGESPHPTTDYVTFSPNQVKSATDNNGDFDTNNPSILFQLAGEPSIRRMAESEEKARILSDLDAARTLEKKFENLDEEARARRIRYATGWERSADGRWKYEIDDSTTRIKAKATLSELLKKNPDYLAHATSGRLFTLGDLLDAPELFRVFPFMKAVRLSFYSDPNPFRAVLTPDGIKVNSRYLAGMDGEKGLKGVLAHEIQHVIQAVEYADSTGIQGRDIEKLYNDMMNAMKAAGTRRYDYDLTSLQNGLDGYMKDAGEIEARNVARRVMMGANERRHTTLQSTEDTARALQNYTLFQIAEDAEKSIDEVLQFASTNGNEKFEKEIGKVSPAFEKLARKHGENIDGYTHSIDNYFVIHDKKNHGNEKTEKARGQIAITDDDIKKIPEVLGNPDFIIFGAKNRQNNNVIVSVKNMSDGSSLYVEEKRTRSKHLAANSLYKTATASNATTLSRNPTLYAQSDRGTVKIVDVKSEIVNEEIKIPRELDIQNNPAGLVESVNNSASSQNVNRTFFQTEKEMFEEAARFDSWEEYKADVEGYRSIFGNDENINHVPVTASDQWYKDTWDYAKRIQKKNEYNDEYVEAVTGETTEENESLKDRQWYDEISQDDEMFENFIRAISYNQFVEHNEAPADYEELQEWDNEKRLRDRANKEAAGPLQKAALVARRYKNGEKIELDEATKKGILTMFRNNKRDFRDLYADFTGDKEWEIPQGFTTNDKISVRIGLPIEETYAYTPKQKQAIIERLDFEDLKKEIKNGTLEMNDERLKQLSDGYEQDIRQLEKKIDALKKQEQENAILNVKQTAELEKLYQEKLEKQAKYEQLHDVRSIKIRLVKDINRRVDFKTINYDEGRKIIAVQRLWYDVLGEYVNNFITNDGGGVDIRDAYSRYQTDFDYRARLQKLAGWQRDMSRKDAADENTLLEEIRAIGRKGKGKKSGDKKYYSKKYKLGKVIDLFETKQFVKLTEEEREFIKKELPLVNYMAELGIDKIAEEREGTIQLDMQSEEVRNILKETLSPEMYSLLSQKALKNWTLEQMEELVKTVNELRKEGREKLAAKKEERLRGAEDFRDKITRTLKDSGIRIDSNDSDEDKEKKKKQIENFNKKVLGRDNGIKGTLQANKERGAFHNRLLSLGYSTANIRRIARILDGGKEGVNSTLLYYRENSCYNEKQRHIRERSEKINRVLEENEIRHEELFEKVHVEFADGSADFTVDELLFFLAADKDENSHDAVCYGNMYDETVKANFRGDPVLRETYENMAKARFAKVIEAGEALPVKFKRLLGAIQEDYAEQYERMNKISIEEWNSPVWRVENYVPIIRLESSGDTNENRVKEDLLGAMASGNSNWVDRGMTKKRIKIPPEYQKPVETGLFSTWADSLERTEHFNAYAGFVRELNRIYKGRESGAVRQLMSNRYGDGIVKYIDDYISEIANPNATAAKTSLDRVIHALRGNTAPAYLAWKMSGIVKQFCTSPWPFLAHMSPKEYAAAALDFVRHPKDMSEAVKSKSEFMNARRFDPIADLIDEQKKKATNKARAKLAEFETTGMQGLEWVDWYCVAPGWLAMYRKEKSRLSSEEEQQRRVDEKRKELEKYRDVEGDNWIEAQAEAARLTEDKIEELAVLKADDVTRLCQPSNRITDLSPMFKHRGPGSEAARTLLQFTTSLNVIWQNLAFDLPQYARDGEFRRVVGTVAGYVLAGIMMGLVTDGFGGDDDGDKDALEKAKQVAWYGTTQFTDAVPLVGSVLSNYSKWAITGERPYSLGLSELFPGVTKVGKGIQYAGKDEWGKACENWGYALGLSLGLPVSGAKEAAYMLGWGDGDGGANFYPSALIGRRPKQ